MSITPETTLADLGEFGLIDHLRPFFPAGEQVLIGSGDDAAVLRVRHGHVVVSTDMLVEGRHFRRDWSSAEDIGHRAAAANLSDINAMGGVAHSLTIGFAAPETLPAQWALDFAAGFAAECALVGATVVGGDVTTADSIVISVTVLGACEVAPVTRAGAQDGDVVALCGRQGWAGAGYAVLARGFRSPRVLVEALRRPLPPYAAGPQAARAGATSMIDISDGLVAEATHVADASGVQLALTRAAFEIPEPFQAVASAVGGDPFDFIMSGGDDHALLATFPAGTTLPEGWIQVGVARHGHGVSVDDAPWEGPTGWRHF